MGALYATDANPICDTNHRRRCPKDNSTGSRVDRRTTGAYFCQSWVRAFQVKVLVADDSSCFDAGPIANPEVKAFWLGGTRPRSAGSLISHVLLDRMSDRTSIQGREI